MKFYNTKCKFICKQIGTYTSDLSKALEWEMLGFDVLFYYNGKYVGELVFGGEIDDISDSPEDTQYGTVFLCDGSFYCYIQDEILNSKPLTTFTYSEILIL